MLHWPKVTSLSTIAFVSVAGCAQLSAQQITARYYPEKPSYLVGEPIIVVFELINNRAERVEIPDSGCRPSDSNDLRDFEIDRASPRRTIELYGCGPKMVVGGCLQRPPKEIPAHGEFHRRLLVEGAFELDSPGHYHVKAKRQWAVPVDTSEFDIELRAPKSGELEAAYQPFFENLYSRDSEVQDLAASAVTQNPPPFAEGVILHFADYASTTGSGFITQLAVDGLRRLGTSAARAKLLEMSSTRSDETVRQPAIEALGQIGNPEDCQPMLAIAGANGNYTQAEAYTMAGHMCKESALATLTSLVGARDSQLLMGVARGLVNTSSRKAVPPLITLLPSPSRDARRSAEDGLAALTHRKSRYGVENEESAKRAQAEWLSWWSANSTTATIFGYDQCAAPQPLF